MTIRFSLLLLFIIGCLPTEAQIVNPDKVKYGNISNAELAMEEYAPYPGADAVVLVDKGLLKIDIRNRQCC